MFRKFTKEDNIKTASPVRSSEQRAIRAAVLQQFPALEPFVEDIFPKKASLIVCKCKDYVQMLLDPNGAFIFFQCRQGPYIPTLRFLHKCAHRRTPLARRAEAQEAMRSSSRRVRVRLPDPDILPKFTVDRGAVPFILGGANIMAPGLTNTPKGSAMDDVPADSVVAVMVAGKEHAIAIGVTSMSSAEIREVNKGSAVENTHWLNDGLWTLRAVQVSEK